MENSDSKNIIFKETQVFYLILIPSIFIIALSILGYIFKKEIIYEGYLVTAGVFFVIAFLMYDLKIVITDKKFKAYFGFGIIKREIDLSEIDIASIEMVKCQWYYGIGIRLTPKGTLFNVKINNAIRFTSKSKDKTFLIGTDHYDEIKAVLEENKKASSL